MWLFIKTGDKTRLSGMLIDLQTNLPFQVLVISTYVIRTCFQFSSSRVLKSYKLNLDCVLLKCVRESM